jgi:hypothetical protein
MLKRRVKFTIANAAQEVIPSAPPFTQMHCPRDVARILAVSATNEKMNTPDLADQSISRLRLRRILLRWLS